MFKLKFEDDGGRTEANECVPHPMSARRKALGNLYLAHFQDLKSYQQIKYVEMYYTVLKTTIVSSGAAKATVSGPIPSHALAYHDTMRKFYVPSCFLGAKTVKINSLLDLILMNCPHLSKISEQALDIH